MENKKHFTKEDAAFFILVAIIGISFSYYTKGINEAVNNFRVENTQLGQASTVIPVKTPQQLLPKTKVLSPNGGEQWIAGEIHTIRWEGISNTKVQNQVEIVLFPWSAKEEMASTSMTAIIASSTSNTGTYEWTIPPTIPTGDYFVRVFCITFANCVGSAGDDSDTSFRILKSGISITFPNGGEKIARGTPLAIQWISANIGKTDVDIRFLGYVPGSDKIVGTTTVLAFGAKNTGSFTWNVPTDLPTNYTYFVSVSAAKTGDFEDRNDKPFTVGEGVSSLVVYCAGSPQEKNIIWKATVSGGTAPYTYVWSGDDELVGDNLLIQKEYTNTTGAKNATLTITSQDGQTAKTTCAVTFSTRGK